MTDERIKGEAMVLAEQESLAYIEKRLRAFAREVERETLVKAAGATCSWCGLGNERLRCPNFLWWRHYDEYGDEHVCYANAIHDLIAALDAPEGEVTK